MVYFLTKAAVDIVKVATKANLQQISKMSTQTPKELRIPVPWGHIAAKEWGPPDGTPLLGIHGWQDNANSFDGLAPLLPRNVRFIAFDTEGHGQSSHLPPGMFYHLTDNLATIRRIVDHLEWKEFSIVGHSLGAGLAVLFASIFPSRVRKVICLDGLVPMVTKPENQPENTESGIDKMMSLGTANEDTAPSYTFDEAVQRYKGAIKWTILDSSVRCLMKRGTVPTKDGKVRYSRDRRVTLKSLLGFSPDQILSYISRFKKEILVILVKDGLFCNEPVRYVLNKKAAKYKYLEVEGFHHVHLDNPEKVAPAVCAFLNESK